MAAIGSLAAIMALPILKGREEEPAPLPPPGQATVTGVITPEFEEERRTEIGALPLEAPWDIFPEPAPPSPGPMVSTKEGVLPESEVYSEPGLTPEQLAYLAEHPPIEFEKPTYPELVREGIADIGRVVTPVVEVAKEIPVTVLGGPTYGESILFAADVIGDVKTEFVTEPYAEMGEAAIGLWKEPFIQEEQKIPIYTGGTGIFDPTTGAYKPSESIIIPAGTEYKPGPFAISEITTGIQKAGELGIDFAAFPVILPAEMIKGVEVKQNIDQELVKLEGRLYQQHSETPPPEGFRNYTREEFKEYYKTELAPKYREEMIRQANIQTGVAAITALTFLGIGAGARLAKPIISTRVAPGLKPGAWVREYQKVTPIGKVTGVKYDIFAYKPPVEARVTTGFREALWMKPKVDWTPITKPQIYQVRPVGGKWVDPLAPYTAEIGKVSKAPFGIKTVREVENIAKTKPPKWLRTQEVSGPARPITPEQILKLPKVERYTWGEVIPTREGVKLGEASLETYELGKPISVIPKGVRDVKVKYTKLSKKTKDIVIKTDEQYEMVREAVHKRIGTPEVEPRFITKRMARKLSVIEPQISSAVKSLNKKGYETWSSGFYSGASTQGVKSQVIEFGGVLEINTISKLRRMGFKVESYYGQTHLAIEQKGKSLSQIKRMFDEAVDVIPQKTTMGIPGKQIRKYYVTAKAEPVLAAGELEEGGKALKVFRTEMGFKERTFPFTRASGKIQKLKGTLIEIPVPEPILKIKIKGPIPKPDLPPVPPTIPKATPQVLEALQIQKPVPITKAIVKFPTPRVPTQVLKEVKAAQLPAQLPYMVGGTGLATIPYAGQALYETAPVEALKIEPKIEQVLIPKIQPKVITKEILKVDLKEDLMIKQVPKAILKEKVVPKEIIKLRERLLLRQKVALKLKQKAGVITTTIGRRIPPPKQISKPVLFKYSYDRKKAKKKKKKREEFFIPEIRRYGKFIAVGKAAPKKRALDIGVRKLKTTLGASLRLRRAGSKKEFAKIAKESKMFRPAGKKGKDMFVLVQKAPYRLGTRPEVAEITIARKGVKFIK